MVDLVPVPQSRMWHIKSTCRTQCTILCLVSLGTITVNATEILIPTRTPTIFSLDRASACQIHELHGPKGKFKSICSYRCPTFYTFYTARAMKSLDGSSWTA